MIVDKQRHAGDRLGVLVEVSRTLIRREQAASGAYPASPTFSAYRGYSWLRDGSFVAEGMSRHDEVASAEAFHSWCAKLLTDRREDIDKLIAMAAAGHSPPPGDMLPTRFTLNGANGTDPWWNFQLDGYGTWLWALGQHLRRHDLAISPYLSAVAAARDYLLAFWSSPCFDWWEEHVEHTHVSTLGAIYAGLGSVIDVLGDDGTVAAVRSQLSDLVSNAGVHEGHLTKWLDSTAVDGSLLACVVPFGLASPNGPVGRSTVEAVEAQLLFDRGVHRYLDDTFYGGGQWPLLTGFLGWYHAVRGDRERALACLEWMAEQAGERHELPEQVQHRLLAPHRFAEWVDRWGQVASPLLWSHGMFLILADELGVHS